MKTLQRFGLVSLAALTLGTLALSNESHVVADETVLSDTTVTETQPVDEGNDTDHDATVEDDAFVVSEEARAEDTDDYSSPADQRFHFSVTSEFKLRGYNDYASKDIYLEKGDNLSISDFVREDGVWEVESVTLNPGSDDQISLTPIKL